MSDEHHYMRSSNTFCAFINERRNAGQADVRVALAFANYHRSYRSAGQEGWFDLVWDETNSRAAITYTTHDKFAKSGADDIFARLTFRTKTRPSRVATRVYKERFGTEPDGHALDVFAQAANAFLEQQNGAFDRIHVLRGEPIGKWYGREMYCKCTDHGGLEGSCMAYTGYNKNGQFEFYKDNAEMAVMLCTDCGYLQSRAIVWTDRVTGDKFMDRIYGNDRNVAVMQDYATSQNWYTVYGHQKRKGVPANTNIQLMKDRRDYPRMPYLDSLMLCGMCNHGYFARHICHTHTITITRPTESFAHDKAPSIPKESCRHCNRPLDHYEDGDEHDELVCVNYEWCEWCDESHCSYYGCHHICDDCGAQYGLWDRCPNRTECDDCGGDYCETGDGCPNAQYCATCSTTWCGDEVPCPECYYTCHYCAFSTLRRVEDEDGNETEIALCPSCDVLCDTCGAHTNANWLPQDANGRCPTCKALLFPARHIPERDFLVPLRQLMTLGMYDVNYPTRYADTTQYSLHTQHNRYYRTMDELWEATAYFRQAAVAENTPMVQTVPVPLDVQHELWVAEQEATRV